MIKDLIILGAGENGRMVVDVVSDINDEKKKFNIIGFLDDDQSKIGQEISGFPILGNLASWVDYSNSVFTSPLVSSPKKNHNKLIVVNRINIPKEKYVNIIHPSVHFMKSVQIGTGNLILPGAQFQSNIVIGSHIYFSNNIVICSNSTIDDYCNFSCSSTVLGAAIIQQGVYVGANSSIIGYTTIGSWSIIGMGAVVLKNINDFEIVAGNPAKVIGENIQAKEFIHTSQIS